MSTKYPTSMSCTEAFDQLTACYSLGGQFRHYYRYGDFNPCATQLAKFKFCILNGSDPVQVQQWYRSQLENNRLRRGSSDEVWQERV